jgi:imidazole glycerol-phosphate synthase subunit HisH
MIVLTDYGLGNIKAFANVYYRLNIPCTIAKTPEDFYGATKIILPGVGSFDYAMQKLNDSGMRETLEKLVLVDKVPVLGICVGMQMLATKSEEGVLPGLGWIKGEVKKFIIPPEAETIRIPHMGWNTIIPKGNPKLLEGINEESRFYFLHTYYFSCADESNSLATTNYAIDFDSVACNNTIFGVQFHPEKSHNWGVRVLENFAKL